MSQPYIYVDKFARSCKIFLRFTHNSLSTFKIEYIRSFSLKLKV